MLFGQKSLVQKASGQSGEEVSLQMQQLRRQETGQIWFKKRKRTDSLPGLFSSQKAWNEIVRVGRIVSLETLSTVSLIVHQNILALEPL